MAIAALAGTATVLTRQFGVVLIPALLAVAWLRRFAARTPALLSLAVLPLVLGAIYQLTIAVSAPTWAQQVNLQAQQAVMSNWRLQSYELLWRPGIILQYSVIFNLPLAIAVSVRWIYNSRGSGLTSLAVAATLGLGIAIGLVAHKGTTMPTLPWNFDELRDFARPPETGAYRDHRHDGGALHGHPDCAHPQGSLSPKSFDHSGKTGSHSPPVSYRDALSPAIYSCLPSVR
jgi:hypothetical protein